MSLFFVTSIRFQMLTSTVLLLFLNFNRPFYHVKKNSIFTKNGLNLYKQVKDDCKCLCDVLFF